MHDEVFSDGVSNVVVTGQIVRIDLVSMGPEAGLDGEAAAQVFRQRIIMPVAAFANSMELLQRVLASLVEAGAVTRNSDLSAEPTMTHEPSPRPRTSRSPNFRM